MMFANRFASKTLVVTGAAQGIGREVALRAAEGGNVLFVDRADFVDEVAAIFVTPSAPTEPPGVLGNIDFGFGFKSPSGVGASLDVAGLTGGGFLSHDDAASKSRAVPRGSCRDRRRCSNCRRKKPN
jgi:NAD(P)-dependent dehydrogenase (short-subunit alcohol dehydrogenase family)